jgi:hypothetical protein
MIHKSIYFQRLAKSPDSANGMHLQQAGASKAAVDFAEGVHHDLFYRVLSHGIPGY